MNRMQMLSCIAVVLMTALTVRAKTITYNFDDGTSQGWINDAKAGREFVPWDTAADDNGGQFIAHSGDFAMRIDEFGVRDGTADLLLITSPEFKISGDTSIVVWALGGMGPIAEPTWTNYDDVPTTATGSGFMGIALRRVSDGEYVLFGRRDRNSESDDSITWTPIEWDTATIATATASSSPSERYVIDVVDSYTGGWGWLGFDEVTLTNVTLISDTIAADPSPADGALDVDPATALMWQPGQFADTHDVYFGTRFEDVNDATVASNVYMGRQSEAEFVPADLELGVTYYWRIDEVNGAPDYTIFKGETWGFTVEPFAYPVPSVAVTSNGVSTPTNGPENTINGSGLNAAGEHSTTSADMWLAMPAGEPLQLVYEFDRIYKLHEMLIWNYNVQFETLLGFGLKDITIEYSESGADWTVLGDVQFAQATGNSDYAANTTVDFGGVPAQSVRLTVNSGYGMTGQFGLSEVRFLFIPAQARGPQPPDGATGVPVGSALSWRGGRDAASHEVFLGTDPDERILVGAVAGTTLATDNLEFGSTYYWTVDAINPAHLQTPVWSSDLWSFSTQEYASIDGFETYTDNIDAGEAIFDTWLDGWVNTTGSTVGYLQTPFAERSIVHSGSQSMPLHYDNTTSPFYSEAERVFDSPQNWTGNGADTLVIHVHGDIAGATQPAGNSPEPMYVRIEDSTGMAATVVNADATIALRPTWQEWKIPYADLAGVNLSRVQTIVIGVGNRTSPSAAGTGTIYIDDIGYGRPAQE